MGRTQLSPQSLANWFCFHGEAVSCGRGYLLYGEQEAESFKDIPPSDLSSTMPPPKTIDLTKKQQLL